MHGGTRKKAAPGDWHNAKNTAYQYNLSISQIAAKATGNYEFCERN